jgi:hypothetical protein
MNELKKDARPRSVRRKQTPPEQTNAEEFYYLKQMAAKTPMVVVLLDGEELRGWIEWYDKGSIKLNRHERAQPADPQAQHPLHVQGRGAARAAAPAAAPPRAAVRRPRDSATPRRGLSPAPRLHPGRPGRHRAPRCWLGCEPAAGPERTGPPRPLLVAEAAALEPLRPSCPTCRGSGSRYLGRRRAGRAGRRASSGRRSRCSTRSASAPLVLGDSGPADAAGALAALDAGDRLVAAGRRPRPGHRAALQGVDRPPPPAGLRRPHRVPGRAAGLERYGRDYLMAFLAPDLQVALLSTHLPLREALDAVTPTAIGEASTASPATPPAAASRWPASTPRRRGGPAREEDAESCRPAVAAAAAAASTSTAPRAPTRSSPAPAAASSTGCSPSTTTRADRGQDRRLRPRHQLDPRPALPPHLGRPRHRVRPRRPRQGRRRRRCGR